MAARDGSGRQSSAAARPVAVAAGRGLGLEQPWSRDPKLPGHLRDGPDGGTRGGIPGLRDQQRIGMPLDDLPPIERADEAQWMDTSEMLLKALWGHLIDTTEGLDFRLHLPISGIETVDDLREAIDEGRRRGSFCNVEEVHGGAWHVHLTEVGAENIGRPYAR